MERSIHEVIVQLEEALLKEVPLGAWTKAPQAIRMVAAILSRFLLLIVEAAVDAFSDAVFEHKKERREAGLKRHERGRKRNILTSVGPLHLRSDVYYDTNQKKHTTVLNSMMDFQKHQKVEEEVRLMLLDCLPFFSVRTSSLIATGGQVSARSIRNYLRYVQIPEPAELEEKRVCETLYVHIDEAHCSTQPKKSK